MNVFESIGLKADPFSTSPSVELFYDAARHKQCLEGLELAIRMKRGLSVVRGGIGVGKTTLSRKLIENFKSESDIFEFHLILDPKFESEIILLKHIIELFGIKEVGDSVQENRNIIENHLLKVGVDKQRTLTLIVDEGQNLPENMLDVFRTLLNFEANDYKLLQLIIFGQPEIGSMISKYPNFEDRISYDFDLGPLSLQDTVGFINHRMKQVGGGDKPWFSQEAIEKIYKSTGGYPRRITRTCHELLLSLLGTDNKIIDVNMFDKTFSNDIPASSDKEETEKKDYSSIAVNKLLDVLRKDKNKSDETKENDMVDDDLMIGNKNQNSDNKESINTDTIEETQLNDKLETSIELKNAPKFETAESPIEDINENDIIIGDRIVTGKLREQETSEENPSETNTARESETKPDNNDLKENKKTIQEPVKIDNDQNNLESVNKIKISSSDKEIRKTSDSFIVNQNKSLDQDKSPGSYPSAIKQNNFLDDKFLHGLSIDYGKIRSAIIKEIKGEKVLVTANKLDHDNPELSAKSTPAEFNEITNHYFHDLQLKLNSDQVIDKKVLSKIEHRSSISLSISGFPMTTKTVSIPKTGDTKKDEIIDWALNNNLPFQSNDLSFSKSETQTNDSLIAAAGDTTDIEAVGDLFKGLGFSIQQFAPEQIAIFNAFKWNYQNLSRQSTIIFHLGERYSYLLVCKGNCLLQAEPILLGIQDLLATEKNLENVKKFWHDRSAYQIPSSLLSSIGINKPNGLFDIEHRQVIEKWQQSFNRALAGIRRNQPLDDQTILLLSGAFCEIKYSDIYFGTALGFECNLFNPFKNIKFLSNQDKNLIGHKYSTYTIPVGMALSNKNKVNLLPSYYKNNELFRFFNKLLIPISAGLIIFLISFSGYTYASYSSMVVEVPKLKAEKKSLEYYQKNYQKTATKKKLINSQLDKMKYDQEYTAATTNLMKYLSKITPNEIELEKIAFHYGYEVSESKRAHGRIFRSTNKVNPENRYASIEGRVNSNSQLMQQYFNFFKDKLENSNMFYSIEIVDASVKAGDGKLTFFIRCEF